MNCNVIDDLTNLSITLPFKEFVNIPQQRENILKIMDEPNKGIEATVTNSKLQQKISEDTRDEYFNIFISCIFFFAFIISIYIVFYSSLKVTLQG
jgi:hypothetical protein